MFENLKYAIGTYNVVKQYGKDYLFEKEACEGCWNATSKLEKINYEGVCKECYSKGSSVCSQCGNSIFNVNICDDGVCEYCKDKNTFDINKDGDSFLDTFMY